jgi:hypothetical protein
VLSKRLVVIVCAVFTIESSFACPAPDEPSGFFTKWEDGVCDSLAQQPSCPGNHRVVGTVTSGRHRSFGLEIENNATFYPGGPNDGRVQNFVTPGLTLRQGKLEHRSPQSPGPGLRRKNADCDLAVSFRQPRPDTYRADVVLGSRRKCVVLRWADALALRPFRASTNI